MKEFIDDALLNDHTASEVSFVTHDMHEPAIDLFGFEPLALIGGHAPLTVSLRHEHGDPLVGDFFTTTHDSKQV